MSAQNEIKQWADSTGRKLGWIASQIPVAQSSLSRWLVGNVVPGAIYRNKLAEVTGIDSVRDVENWIKKGDLS